MRTNIAAALVVTAISTAAFAAESTPTVTTDADGDSARACLEFERALDTGADAHPGDFLTIEPAARPTVTASGSQLCLDGLGYGAHYSITVHPGVAFINSRLDAAETVTADTPDRDLLVAVGGRGWVLPRQGATGVAIQTVNVPLVRIRVLRLAARKVAADAGGDAAWVDALDPSKQSWHLYELRGRASSMTQIWSGTMQAGPGRNRTVETAFPLAGIVDPAKPGAYLVLAEDAAKPVANLITDPKDEASFDYGQQVISGHWVLSTDLAISSLQGQGGLHVTVRSLGSAAPIPGVRLQLRAKSQDTLAETTTDAQGSAVFAPALLRGKLASAATALVASAATGDFTAQSLAASGFDLSDRGADGRVSPGPIEAFVYTDRGIYRPGETINVTALLRTAGLSAVDGTGLTLVLRRPDGVEAARTTLPPAPDAGFEQALALSATAAQGDWTVEAFVVVAALDMPGVNLADL